MPYKKLWIASGVVMLVSFAVLGGVGYKGISNGPPTRAKWSLPTVEYCSRAKRFATGKMSGSQPAVRKSGRSGATALMSLPTGARIIFTANR